MSQIISSSKALEPSRFAPKKMDDMDTDAPADRRDAAAGNAAQALFPSPPPYSEPAGDAGGPDNAWSFLALARQLVDQGKPSLALQAVLAAMRSGGGDEAVLETLQRARALYRSRLQSHVSADELASLFAECAIAEAQPQTVRFDNPPTPSPAATAAAAAPLPPPFHPPVLLGSDETSILAMSGRKQVMLDAFADGSSFVCLKCGGLVSIQRKDEHFAYWCG